jgi:hypothetical protein
MTFYHDAEMQIRALSNKCMHPTANSAAFIENLLLITALRRVMPGVMWLAGGVKMNKLLGMVLVLSMSSVWTLAQGKRRPRFENYPAKRFLGKPAPARISSRVIRDDVCRAILSQQAQKGPNFAGHYTIVRCSCGSGCSLLFIVDARTGRFYDLSPVDSVAIVIRQDEEHIQYRIDSRLLVLAGGIGFNDGSPWEVEGKYYYEWRGGRLKLIRRDGVRKY